MELNPHLAFNGDCAEAFRFYEHALGGKIAFRMTWGESPMAQQMPPGWSDKIIHMRMTVGDRVLMGSDAPPDRYQKPQGMTVALGIEAPEEAERVFKALADKGTVQMPIQETFWAQRFGMVTDRFGTPWMINCEGKK